MPHAPHLTHSLLVVRARTVLLACVLAGARLPGECDRATFTIRGGGGFGAAIVKLGDLDGDGVEEYAAGSPGPSEGPGVVHVVSGRTALRLLTIPGEEAGGAFGSALALLETKLSGEPPVPVSLLAVGAPCSGAGRGRVTVHAVSAVDAREVFHLEGAEAGDLLGVSLSTLPGGEPLLIVGAPGERSGGTRRGRVLLIDGRGDVRSESSGERNFEGYGFSISAAGDVDGDGVGDVLVGSQDPRPGGDHAGRVTVRRRDGTLLVRIHGAGEEQLGGALTGAGDLDGDGFGDFLAGASEAAPLPPCLSGDTDGAGPGRVLVLRGGAQAVTAGGTLGAPLRVLGDGERGALFGASLSVLDDLDGDGAAELAVGAPHSSLGGKPRSGRIEIFRGSDGSPLWTIGGARADDRLGMVLLGVDDKDGDGTGDLLAASRRQSGEVGFFSLGDGNGDGERDACETCPVPEDLILGAGVVFTSTRLVRQKCFRFQAPRGAVLRFRLMDETGDASPSLILRWGAPPEHGLFDQGAWGPGAAAPGLIVSSAPGGEGFLIANAARGSVPSTELRLLAEVLAGPTLLDMTPSRSAVRSPRDLSAAIRGAGLRAGVTFALRPAGGGAALPSLDVVPISPFLAHARFDLRSAAPGAHDLVLVEDGVVVAVLPDAFQVTASTVGEAYRVTLGGPPVYRSNFLSRLTLRVGNLGDRPLPPPLFLIAGPPGTLFSFSRDAGAFSTMALGLAHSAVTPDGSLPPGSEVAIPVWFRRKLKTEECPPLGGECLFSFEVRLFEPRPAAPLSWDQLPAPPGMDPGDWESALPALAMIGPTWTHYYQEISRSSALLASRGMSIHTALPAFQIAVRRALGLPVAAITGVVRGRELGMPAKGVVVAALLDDEPLAYTTTNGEGYFVLDWLENGLTYRLEVIDPKTTAVLESGSPEVKLPDEGDLHGVDLSVAPPEGGRTLVPACPPCEATALPLEPIVPPPDSFTRRAGFTTPVISSFDPNEKNGSGTQGGDAEVDPAEAIEYRIYFENMVGEGGAAARHVEIIDVLPPELDWTTVELLDVAIETQPDPIFVSLGGDEGSGAPGGFQGLAGGSGLPVNPSSLPSDGGLPFAAALWSGDVEYRVGETDVVSLDLSIVANVEPAAEVSIDGGERGVVTWTLQAILESGASINQGFLPYDCPVADGDDPAGDVVSQCGGFVSFTVRASAGVADGAVVTNEAEIIFDCPDKPGLTDCREGVITDPAATITIKQQPPGIPSSPSPPADGALLVPSRELRLAWEAPYAETYDLFLWSAAEGDARPVSPEQAVVWQPGLLTAHYPPGEETLLLPQGDVWLWQVVAGNGRGEAAEGPVWRFTTSALFRRGDVDLSGALQITDAVLGLGYLFLGGESPRCLDALDADDSGLLDITDPILVLSYLFLGGADIPPPGPVDCGIDPTPDSGGAPGTNDLGCVQPGPCEA